MNSLNELPKLPIGAREVILECQEILAGQRQHLTSVSDYTEQRRRYWQMHRRSGLATERARGSATRRPTSLPPARLGAGLGGRQ